MSGGEAGIQNKWAQSKRRRTKKDNRKVTVSMLDKRLNAQRAYAQKTTAMQLKTLAVSNIPASTLNNPDQLTETRIGFQTNSGNTCEPFTILELERGSGINQMNGAEVNVSSIAFKGFVGLDPLVSNWYIAGEGTTGPIPLRLCVVQDFSGRASDAQATTQYAYPGDWYQTWETDDFGTGANTDFFSHPDPEKKGDFKILFDETFVVETAKFNPDDAEADAAAQYLYPIELFFRPPKTKVEGSELQPNTRIGNGSKNQIYCFAMAYTTDTVATSIPLTVQGTWRVWFSN